MARWALGMINGNTLNSLAEETRAACRGVFVPRQSTKFRDILDGLSNTIMGGEIRNDLGDLSITTNPVDNPGTGSHNFWKLRNNPKDCFELVDTERPQFWDASVIQPSGSGGSDSDPWNGFTTGPSYKRGYLWAAGNPLCKGFQTILAPPHAPRFSEPAGLFCNEHRTRNPIRNRHPCW